MNVKALASLLFTALIFVCEAGHTQEMPFFGGGERGNPFSISLDDAFLKGDGSPATEEGRGSIHIPLYTSDEVSSLIHLRGQRIKLDRPVTIPDRSVQIPEEFGSAEIGLSWGRRDVIGNANGFTASIGSSGRRLLNEDNSRVVSGTWFMEKTEPDGNSWIYLVNYSNNRTFLNNIPLPGIAYAFNSKESKLILGVPFIFYFKRAGKAMLNFTVSPFFGSAEASLFVFGPIQLFSGVAWAPKAYQNLVPGNNNERLFYDKKEWTTGVRVPVSRGTSFALAYTYAFDRRFLLGEKITAPSSSSLHLDDTGGVQFRAKVSF